MGTFDKLITLLSLILCVSSTEDFLLVFTLDGKLSLVNKCTGAVQWTYDSGLVNDCTYSGDVIIIPEIHSGRLYEYSGGRSGDLLYRINSSIFEMVLRSPESINSLYTTGYKADHWLQLDLDTGEILKSARCFSPFQCYSSNIDGQVPSRRILDLGMSEYHLMLWDLATGVAKVNMTYQFLPSHLEPDLQVSNLTHVATLEPSIVTYERCKFLWHLPLTAPVVDLFSVETPPPSPLHGKVGETERRDYAAPSTPDRFLPVKLQRDAQCAEQSHRLRRIVFTTYALALNNSYSLAHYPTQSALWEEKLGQANKFVPALYVGEAGSPPLYAVHTLAEVTLELRHVHRVAEHLRLAYESRQTAKTVFDLSPLVIPKAAPGEFWPKSLIGLYYLSHELPQVNPVWSPPSHPSHHLYRLTDQSHSSGRPLLPMQVSDIHTTTGFPKEVKTVLWTFSTVAALIVSVTLVFALRMRNRARRYLHYQTPWDHASPLLHPSFDCADREGWAGHPLVSGSTAQGQRTNPEIVRFNLRRVLGSGANGTIVFEGTYGTQPVAVKRILRRVELEKSWLREHRILMNHHHEHLIRCFWTGSSPNFHYLVLQRCVTSLLEALDTEEGASLSVKRNPLSRFGLSPVQCVRQLLNAVVFLHSKSIVHRDIKPSNIFILQAAPSSSPTPSFITAETAVNRLVLGDFGLSLPLENGFFTNTVCIEAPATISTTSTTEDGGGSMVGAFTYGSLGWMAPEMCTSPNVALTQSVDVFAFGLVAFFILSLGSHPFSPSLGSFSTLETKESTPARPRRLRDVYTSLASLQSMQKAINDLQVPRLNDLDNCVRMMVEVVSKTNEEKPDKMRSCLAKQLIQEALNHDPSNRCSIEVLAGSPLFWTAEDIMAFYTEISNFMDESKPLKFASGSGSFHPLVERIRPGEGGDEAAVDEGPMNGFHSSRQRLSTALDDHWERVFSGSWLRHLDPVLVDDLRSVRSYQDKSLTQLLRAIRNKRNHIWSLRNAVRDVLGSSDMAMAEHWNSRFPSLLPLTYCLARVHLAEVDHFRRFLPAPLTADVAEHFISEHCHPSEPKMWARLSVSENGSPPLANLRVSPLFEHSLNGDISEEIKTNIAKIKTFKHGSPLQITPRVRSKARTLTNPWHLPSKRPVCGGDSNNNASSSTISEAVAAVMAVPTNTVNGETVDPVEENGEDGAEDGFVLPKARKRTRRRKTVSNNARMRNL